MSGPLLTKAFNLFPIDVSSSFVMQPNQFNAVYANVESPSILVIPPIAPTIDGFVIFIKNNGPANLTVESPDLVFSAIMTVGETLLLTADTYNEQWNTLLGPITAGGGGAGNITGPTSSTDGAIVLWNGTSGTVIKNSAMTIVGNTLSTVSGPMIFNANSGIISFDSADLININSITTNSITNTSGTYQQFFGNKVEVVGAAPTNILSIPITTGTSQNITLEVSVTNETNNIDTAAYTMFIKAKNIGGTISSTMYGTFGDADSSLSTGSIILTAVGGNFIVQGSGVVGITTGYEATATTTGITF